MSMSISLQNVSLAFPEPGGKRQNIVFENFGLSVEAGSFTVLLGPSGCGKSTLLNVINGLLEPSTADEINVGGEDIRRSPELTRQMAYVFQSARLLPWRTLGRNVEFGLKGLAIQPREHWDELISKYFEIVGLTQFVDYYPGQVSGGMQQRTAIVRAWANEPQILLMDEPFSHLDEITASELRRQLIALWTLDEDRRTVVFVTHDISEAVQLATEIVVLTSTPATVCYSTKVELPWPRSPDRDAVFELEREIRQVFNERVGVNL